MVGSAEDSRSFVARRAARTLALLLLLALSPTHSSGPGCTHRADEYRSCFTAFADAAVPATTVLTFPSSANPTTLTATQCAGFDGINVTLGGPSGPTAGARLLISGCVVDQINIAGLLSTDTGASALEISDSQLRHVYVDASFGMGSGTRLLIARNTFRTSVGALPASNTLP